MKSFFTDQHGKVVIAQFPNVLITAWVVVIVVRLVTDLNEQALSRVADMLLFAWAYLELRRGDSNFRKVLGAVVLAYIVIRQFV